MRLRRVSDAFAALIALTGLLAGPPLVLLIGVGNPLPQWSSLGQGAVDDVTLLRLLACLVWIAWAQFAAGTLLEANAAVRGIGLPRRIALGQGVARTLITVLATTIALGPLTGSSAVARVSSITSGPPIAARVPVSAADHQLAPRSLTGAHRVESDSRNVQPAGTAPYTVGSDPTISPTLWSIADHTLGDPLRWREIWQLNQHRVMTDGRVFTDPDDIRDGWTLYLPAPPDAAWAPHAGGHVDTVRPGDTLSAIAATEYGDPGDYPLIAAANHGHPEPGGAIFTNPSKILPGWTITIPPAPATDPGPATTSSPTPAPRSGSTPNGSAPGITLAPPPTPAPSVLPTTTSPSGADSVPPATAAPTGTSSPAPSPPTSPPRAPIEPRTSAASPAPPDQAPLIVGGAATLLAGLSLAALARRRRRQARHRRPGRMIATPPPALAQTEKKFRLTAEQPDGADVSGLDTALRNLVHTLAADPDAQLPDVVAVRMTGQQIELILTGPHGAPPGDWSTDAAGTRWTLHRDRQRDVGWGAVDDQWAPYPALVSIGHTGDGEQWLLDLERVGVLRLAGDPDRCLDLARFLVAELAHNSWSDHLQVSLVGLGPELEHLNPDRVCHPHSQESLIGQLRAQLSDITDVIARTGADVLRGRLHGVAADAWTPHIGILANPDEPDGELDTLTASLGGRSARAPVALILTDSSTDDLTDVDTDSDPDGVTRPGDHHGDGRARTAGWRVHLSAGGTLTVPALDLTVIAAQLPAHEAADLAALLTLAGNLEGQPIPPARGGQAWDAYADAAGAPRTGSAADPPGPCVSSAATGRDRLTFDETLSHSEQQMADLPTRLSLSVLPLPAEAYLDRSAATSDDLAALAPAVSETTRRNIHSADPELDADFTAWQDPDSGVPKLRLLGPVRLDGVGPAPAGRGALLAEIIAYLLTRSYGATPEQLAADIWPHIPDAATKTTPRQSVSLARQWLGTSARTGRERIPRVLADSGGVKRYQVHDVLLDAELFRRLRLRGTAGGPDGISDLRAALELVTGVPFEQRRPAGYTWLAETPLDHEYAATIADTAHLVATHDLGAGDPESAAAAALVALRVNDSDDVALLDLIAACDALGHHAQAQGYVRRLLLAHDAEVEEDLPPRTYEVLRRRGWLPA